MMPTTLAAPLPPAGGPCRGDSQSRLPHQARYRIQNITQQLYAGIKGGEGSRGRGARWRYLRGGKKPRCALPLLGRRPQQDSTVSCDKSEVCSGGEGGLQGAVLISPCECLARAFLFDRPISEHWVDSKKEYSLAAAFISFFHCFIYSFICRHLLHWHFEIMTNFLELVTKHIRLILFVSLLMRGSGLLSYLCGGFNCRSFSIVEVTVTKSWDL